MPSGFGQARWFPYLLEGVEVVLHALDGDILAVLDALRLEHLREGALALLGHQPVLCTTTGHSARVVQPQLKHKPASLPDSPGANVSGCKFQEKRNGLQPLRPHSGSDVSCRLAFFESNHPIQVTGVGNDTTGVSTNGNQMTLPRGWNDTVSKHQAQCPAQCPTRADSNPGALMVNKPA